MTRPLVATPEEPEKLSAQVEQAFISIDPVEVLEDYAEFLCRRGAYTPKYHSFVITKTEGASLLEFKSRADSSGSVGRVLLNDIFGPELAISLQATAEPPKIAQRVRVSPQKLTGLAVLIAGRKRAVIGNEWRAHLSGETGSGLSADRQVREAAGFVLAAIRYRLRDAADLAWRPVDAVLGSRALSSLFVFLASVGFSLWLMQKIGVYGLAQCLESVGVVFGAALGTIHVGRWWRGVKPPEHKPRQAKKLQRTSVDKLPSY
jgi:hypothetical protein